MGLSGLHGRPRQAQYLSKAEKQVLELQRLTDTTTKVRTADKIIGKDGETIAQWGHVYVLSDTDDGIKAVTAFPDLAA